MIQQLDMFAPPEPDDERAANDTLAPRLLALMAAHGWRPTGAAWYEASRGYIREWTRGHGGDEAELPDNLIEEVVMKWR